MELPDVKSRQQYRDEVKVIESNLKDIANGDAPQELYSYTQSKLDQLAERYQHDKNIGTTRYKLYELQALLFYFQDRDEEALDFIQHAIKTKGESYRRAEKILSQINEAAQGKQLATVSKTKSSNKESGNKKLVGLDGWLALFIVGVGIGILYNLYQLSTYIPVFKEMESLRREATEFVSSLIPILWFEVLMFTGLVVVGVWLIVLFIQRKKIAKYVAIFMLAGVIVLGIVDYVWASSVFRGYDIDMRGELSEQAGAIGRATILAFIWIPYFLVSKRVEATLTK